MPNTSALSRRQFLKASLTATATAPFFLPAHIWAAETPPSERIVVGFIGVGTQGRGLLGGFLGNKDVVVVAVNDVDTTRREYCQQRVNNHYAKASGASYQGCAAVKDFREITGRTDIDAVCIATPDHWHAIPVIAAANAKKDIYCEKPLSLTIGEARAMANAVRKNDRVFQTGSMQRSSSEFRKACELVRNGFIGKVEKVIADVGGPSRPCNLPEEPLEPGLDWDFWLGPAPVRPYNSELSPRRNPDAQKVVHQHFPNWRNYREYSGGAMTDWGAHHFDIAQWGLGMDETGPVEIIPPADPKATKGLKFVYANGVVLEHGDCGGVLFIGDKGTILVNRGKFQATPESIGEAKIPENGIHLYRSSNHVRDFLDCVKTRKRPICDVEVGARSVTVCHLGNLAYWNHRTLKWDPAKEQFIGDAEANTWINRPTRAPWKLPA
jgi:predicted dehydrogenase